MMRKIALWTVCLLVVAVIAFILWPEKRYVPYEVSADYRAQAESYNVPPMPGDWEWHDFMAADGTRLRWGETGNRGAAKASLVWVPGFTATLDMYGEHFDRLARRGFHVIGLDLRGQGGSQRARAKFPEKLWVKDFAVYSDDLADFIEAQKLPNDRPSLLAGVSFGGHVATRMIVDYDSNMERPIDGLYLIAPAWKPRSDPYTFEKANRIMAISRRLGKSHNYVVGQGDWQPVGLDYNVAEACSSNPARLFLRDAIFTRMPEQRVGGVTNQWGAEFFKSSARLTAPEYIERLTLPTTIISAAKDSFVVTDVNSRLCKEAAPNCREVKIANTQHCLPQEDDVTVMTLMNEVDSLYEHAQAGRPR